IAFACLPHDIRLQGAIYLVFSAKQHFNFDSLCLSIPYLHFKGLSEPIYHIYTHSLRVGILNPLKTLRTNKV
ncbi:hypothetical protein DL98DRAFT_523376, partial [Cadophora sp. DSE1049]